MITGKGKERANVEKECDGGEGMRLVPQSPFQRRTDTVFVGWQVWGSNTEKQEKSLVGALFGY